MHCLAITLNGNAVCVAGGEDAALLDVSVGGWLRGDSPATLDVAGMSESSDGRNAHVYWCECLPLMIGDVVRVTFCQAAVATQPSQIKFTDTAEYAEEQRAFEEFGRSTIFPPKPMPIRFPGLSIAIALNDQRIVTATLTSGEEHFLASTHWLRWHPHRCRVYARSFGEYLSEKDRETDWYRAVLNINDTLEFRVGTYPVG